MGSQNKKKFQLGSIFSILSMLVLIIVASFASVGWDYKNINSSKFISSFSIFILIATYALPTGENIFTNWLKNKENGSFINSRNSFVSIVNKINDEKYLVYLPNYVKDYFKKKRYDTYIQLLTKSGILQPEKILELDRTEIELLKTQMIKKTWKDGTNTPLFTINEYQYQVIMGILDGDVSITTLDHSFYIQELDDGRVDNETRAKHNERYKASMRRSMIIQYISLTFVSSLILAGLIPQDGGSIKQTLVDTASRIFILISGLSWGAAISRVSVKVDIDIYEIKTTFLNTFEQALSRKIYIPIDINKEAEKLYEETIAKEQVKDGTNRKEQRDDAKSTEIVIDPTEMVQESNILD